MLRKSLLSVKTTFNRLSPRLLSYSSGDSQNPVLRNIEIVTPPTISKEVLATLSLNTANQKQIVQHKISHAVTKYRVHPADTGSPEVQSMYYTIFEYIFKKLLFKPCSFFLVAVMTEKIRNMARHFTVHKRDKHSLRSFEVRELLKRDVFNVLLSFYSLLQNYLTHFFFSPFSSSRRY